MRSQFTQLRLFFAAILLTTTSTALAEHVQPSERVVRSVVVRADPDGSAPPVGKLNPGQSATLESEVSGWYQIVLADGTKGYVSKSWTVVRSDDEIASSPAGATYRVHIIDVGTGLAIFVEGPDFTLIYDGGSQDDLADGDDNRILAYIRKVHPGLSRIDHLILSHPHKDHLELLPDLFDAYSVGNVWDSGRVNKTQGYCRFLKKVEAEPGVLYHDAIASNATRQVQFGSSRCGGTITLREATMMNDAPVRLGNGASMSILYRDAINHPDPNENSVVVRLDLGTRRVLFAGDAEGGSRKLPSEAPDAQSIEGQLSQCCAAALHADVLVVGHHGSLTSSRRAFLDAVGATTFIISSGPYPYKSVVLPDEEVVAELKTRGQVFRTDMDDGACASNTSKIGPDNDESPGGCSNVTVSLSAAGIVAAYDSVVD